MRLIIDTRLLGRGGTTGIPGYTHDLIDALIQRYPNEQYTLFYNAAQTRSPLPRAWLTHPQVRVVNRHIPNRLLSLLLRMWQRPAIENLIPGNEPSDLLWSPHLDLLTTKSIPRVITVHDISFMQYPAFFSTKYHIWSWLQNQTAQIQSARHIIAVSEYTKRDLVDHLKIPADRISVIYSGINPSFQKMDPQSPLLTAYRERWGLTQPFFLYLGTVEARKNVSLLVRAFDEFKRDTRWSAYQLVIAGRPGRGAREVEDLARASRYSSDIRFIHDVRDDERVLLYNLARCFVFPSFFEGFGFPPLEAQACGTPVIASNRTSLPEILGESALLTDPWNVSALTELLVRIESDAALREKLIQRGIANTHRFNWQTAAEQSMQVFTEMLH